MNKKKILIISHVLPFPGDSGQQQRVAKTLRSLKLYFHITFLTVGNNIKDEKIKNELLKHCDRAILMPSLYNKTIFHKIFYKLYGYFYLLTSGLKPSNFIIGKLEFSFRRIKKYVHDIEEFDIFLFEYFHAYETAKQINNMGKIVCLDTHNILWQAYKASLMGYSNLPIFLIDVFVQRYKKKEEYAWSCFDIVIAINFSEYDYIKKKRKGPNKVLMCGMGIDIKIWKPELEKKYNNFIKIAYYGALASIRNSSAAVGIYENILPKLWLKNNKIEFWIIGSNPPSNIIDIGLKDDRVKVTGFVENIINLLSNMTFAIIPFQGTYGFRSRIVELMSVELPVITTRDAVDGMGFSNGEGIFFADDLNDYISHSSKLLEDNKYLEKNKKIARLIISNKWDLKNTYDKLSHDLYNSI